MKTLLKKIMPGRVKRAVKHLLGRFDTAADARDVHYCYRLLLGRLPDADGFRDYRAKAKSGVFDIHGLVRAFIDSEEFRARNIFHFQPVASSEPLPVRLDEFEILATPADSGPGELLLRDGEYEPHLTARLREALKPGMTFLDIGANIGYFSLLAAALVGEKGRVIAFDPIQYNCALLMASAARNRFNNIQVHPFAAAEKNTLMAFTDTGSNGYMKEIDFTETKNLAGSLLIRAMSLDEMSGLPDKIDMVKIDVEGGEHSAMLGARKLIRRAKPRLIFSEFSPPMLNKVSGVGGEEYLRLLLNAGYVISVIRENGELIHCEDRIADVMEQFIKSGSTHIDLMASRRES